VSETEWRSTGREEERTECSGDEPGGASRDFSLDENSICMLRKNGSLPELMTFPYHFDRYNRLVTLSNLERILLSHWNICINSLEGE
jgi:hypothetical protein